MAAASFPKLLRFLKDLGPKLSWASLITEALLQLVVLIAHARGPDSGSAPKPD